MKISFLTTTNHHNGYGMTREYFLKFLPKEDIILEDISVQNDAALILHIPPAIQHCKNPIKILYTMLEGDTVPDSWRQYLEKADHILVPSEFVRQTFEKAGFKSMVIPLGYDPEVFKYVERIQAQKPYTFLHYEAFQDRKGWEELLDAWLYSGLAEEEFDAKLILKTVKSYKDVYEIIAERQLFIPYNVRIICGEIPHHSIFDLLGSVDCFIFPSRGEGFSLPPIEAMATGLPVIISKGHSHLDYYDENYMYGVDANIKIPATYSDWEDQGYFVRCNIDELAKTLKYVYENKEEARNKGKLASGYIKKYSYNETARKIKEFLWQLSDQQLQKI